MPFIWFQLFDVGLPRKSVSIETIPSLMQHVKSCVSVKLVYVLFWNLKGGLGKTKHNKLYWNVCLFVAAPTTFTQQTFSASPYWIQPFPSLCRQPAAEKEQHLKKLSTPVEFGPLRHTPKGRILSHLMQERSPAFNKLSAFDPESQEPDHPSLICSCWLIWSEWNHSSCSEPPPPALLPSAATEPSWP